jgi:hypothetical protein
MREVLFASFSVRKKKVLALSCLSRRALLAVLLAGCAVQPPSNQVMLAPDLAFDLPPPALLGRDLAVAHLVTARWRGREVSFEGQIEAANGVFRLAVLDPLGRRALTVVWDAAGLAIEKGPAFPDDLRAENLLADLVLIYWPAPVLRRALAPAELRETADGRELWWHGRKIIELERSEGGRRLRYANFAFGYTLDIRATGEKE